MANSDHLLRMAQEGRELAEGMVHAELAIIETTANSLDDVVLVTLPNSEAPYLAEPVAYWRLGVGLDGGDLVPRYPTAGQEGLAIHMDTGEIWLIH